MTARRVDLPALLAGYRAACADAGLDSLTGNPRACADPRWWAVPALWEAPGRAHSSVEAEALASIAAQARAAAGQPEPQTISDVVREALAELRAERAAQHTISLADLHARRGARVEYIDMGGWLRPILVEAA